MHNGRSTSIGTQACLPARHPAWARWQGATGRRYTLGAEEELMLVDAFDRSLAQRSDRLLSGALTVPARPETHAGVMELATGIHRDAAGAVTELSAMRTRLAGELRPLGILAACAGVHPMASAAATRISEGDRYRGLAESLRFLAHREPTLALHVHVGVPDPDDAVRLLNRLCEVVPLLIALSANSPFCGGRDTGFASARTAIFGGFPRTGTPPPFGSYSEYVDAVDVLIASGAVPDPTFLWWDVRLQPTLGTVEVRAMDAQSSVSDSAALIALIQSLARLELEDGPRSERVGHAVLAENRFLAARDGMDARLVDATSRRLVPAAVLLERLVRDCRPHAAVLGCSGELEAVSALATANGARRQRRWVADGNDLSSLVSALAEQFVSHRSEGSGPCVAGLPTAVPLSV